MAFKSWQSYLHFTTAVTYRNRYIFDEETQRFLEEVLKTCKSREQLISAEAVLWRAQLGTDSRFEYDDDGNEIGDVPCHYSSERMKPMKYSAIESRVNPKGISYLYLATSKETAMSEVRPWIGSKISVARFKIKKELTLVNCALSPLSTPFFFNVDVGVYEPEDDKKESAVWTYIDKAFSRPIAQNENQAHYAPTQIIAELFRGNGYDGVVYKSVLGDGYNVALFNPDNAEMLDGYVSELKKISFSFGFG